MKDVLTQKIQICTKRHVTRIRKTAKRYAENRLSACKRQYFTPCLTAVAAWENNTACPQKIPQITMLFSLLPQIYGYTPSITKNKRISPTLPSPPKSVLKTPYILLKLFNTRLNICKKDKNAVPLHCVFHSIRFKVNKIGVQRYSFFYFQKYRRNSWNMKRQVTFQSFLKFPIQLPGQHKTIGQTSPCGHYG